jgi:hypothetical protein
MKNLYESILDNEDALIDDARNTGATGFEDAILATMKEISSRFEKASKDKKLKDIKFPSDNDIYPCIYEVFKNAASRGKKATSTFSGNNKFEYCKILYTGKLSAEELNDERPVEKNVTYPHECASIIHEYFDKASYGREIKIKSNIGIVLLRISISGYWFDNGSGPYMKFTIGIDYKGDKKAAQNIIPRDVFGHEIHEGDWCAGTTKTISQIIYGKAKFTKARDKMYIDKCTVEFENCIVIKHDSKPVDMSDVKDKSIELKI